MDDERIVASSGNIYKDFGYPDADDMQTKAGLVMQLQRIIDERGLTQQQAAEILGIDQPKVSNLLRGRFRGYSVSRLMAFLNAFDQDVEIVVRPKSGDRSHAQTIVRLVAEEEPAYTAEG